MRDRSVCKTQIFQAWIVTAGRARLRAGNKKGVRLLSDTHPLVSRNHRVGSRFPLDDLEFLKLGFGHDAVHPAAVLVVLGQHEVEPPAEQPDDSPKVVSIDAFRKKNT